MLDPITQKWEDRSDLQQFTFSFYCDCCGGWVGTLQYRFNSGFKPKIIMSEAERKARELIWQKDHDAAYERANNEAMIQLNQCRACGRRVCDDCYSVFDDLCVDCARKKAERST